MSAYTSPSISGYNSNPPTDDGQNISANEITWAGIKNKLSDPLKTYIDAIESQVSGAFGSSIEVVATLATAKGKEGATSPYLYIKGRSSTGDGYEGIFYWDSSDLSTEVTADTQNGIYIPPDSDSTGASGAWVRAYDGAVIVTWFGASPSASAADNQLAFDAAVIRANTDNLTLDLVGGSYSLSALWHVNLPINIDGRGATLTGGDADGVMWYGYRTGANQDSYFIGKFVRDIKFAGTNTAGTGFTSSKSIACDFKSLDSENGAGNGLSFRAAVGCSIGLPRAYGNGFHGIQLTYFTNSDGVTHVPSTANSIYDITSEANGSDGSATVLNSYGVLCDKDPDGKRAAYGNTFHGGYVQLNQFTGARDFGDNEWNGVWLEHNGLDAGSSQQYNFQDSGPHGSIVRGGRNQGAGVLRKMYVDGAVDTPKCIDVIFDGTLQTDIEYEQTITGTHTGADNAAVLTDNTKAWKVDALVGKVISNTTDGSTATITANTEQAVTGVLSGGTDDDWDASDAYTIADAGATDFIQDGNQHSGASSEIVPTSWDMRDLVIGLKRKNTSLGAQEDSFTSLTLGANSSGSNQFYSIGQVDNNTDVGLISCTVHVDGAPPTLLGQVVEHHATNTGSNQYIRFTLLNTERYSSSTGDSNTADIPVIRITSTGDIQYKHNNGSSAQLVQVKYLKLNS